MIKNTFTSLGFLVGALSMAAYSCSSSETGLDTSGLGSPSTANKGGSSATAAGGTSSNTGATGGASTGTGTGGTSGTAGKTPIGVGEGQSDGGETITEDAACGTGKASATLKPVNMLFMYDRSWSMNECADGTMTEQTGNSLSCPSGGSRWKLTSDALIQFFQSPQAADLNVALRFFPDDKPAPGCDGFPDANNPGNFGGFQMGGGQMGGGAGTPGTGTAGAGSTAAAVNCDVPACAQPLVDIAPLLADPAPTDKHEADLVAAVMAGTPPGPDMPNPNPSTPTYPALGGAEQWATTYQTAHPEGQAVVVLVTDGEPMGCDTNGAHINTLASDAYTNAGVLTYVIGLSGSSESGLTAIATAGHGKAYFVTDGDSATQQFIDALNAIKGMALSCTLDVPKSDDSGQQIDPRLINVNYASGSGDPTELGYVDSAAACGDAPAWYYDNPAAPTQIILCDNTCKTIKADTMANLQILAGCKPHIVAR